MSLWEALPRLRLADPHWMWLLLFVPLFVYLHARANRRRASIKFSSLDLLKEAHPEVPWARIVVPAGLRTLTLIFIPIALARPQIDKSTQTIKESGVDIVLAVDLSASMLALDMGENQSEDKTRLDVVKQVLKEFVSKRRHDRIGLVAFSVNPYLLCPLTLDKEYLLDNLDRLRVGLTKQTGTNIGGALGEGINRVRNLEAKSRIVILLTDGKDDPPPRHSPMVFAEGAKKDGIKIYTIAVGKAAQTRSYVYDIRQDDLVRNYANEPEVTIRNYPVDKEILKKIAEKTEARFFEAEDEDRLREIYDEIDQLEKTEVAFEVNALYEELFHWPLGLSVIFLLVEIVLSRTLFLRIP